MGFKCVVKWLHFWDFKEIAFLIIAFVACDWLGHIRLYYVFKDCDLGENSQSKFLDSDF